MKKSFDVIALGELLIDFTMNGHAGPSGLISAAFL